MAFVAAKNTAFKLDNAAGTLVDISTYIDSVGGIANTTDITPQVPPQGCRRFRANVSSLVMKFQAPWQTS